MLEKPLYSALQHLARQEGVSLSMLMRDLAKEALELREDQALAEFAEQRENSFDRDAALTHEAVWQ